MTSLKDSFTVSNFICDCDFPGIFGEIAVTNWVQIPIELERFLESTRKSLTLNSRVPSNRMPQKYRIIGHFL